MWYQQIEYCVVSCLLDLWATVLQKHPLRGMNFGSKVEYTKVNNNGVENNLKSSDQPH